MIIRRMTHDSNTNYQAAEEKARKEERLARMRKAEEQTKLREREYGNRRRSIESVGREMSRSRDYGREGGISRTKS